MADAVTVVRVSYHPSGRYTLTCEKPGEGAQDEIMDGEDFYRKVAAFLGRLAAQGVDFTYEDTDLDRR